MDFKESVGYAGPDLYGSDTDKLCTHVNTVMMFGLHEIRGIVE